MSILIWVCIINTKNSFCMFWGGMGVEINALIVLAFESNM